jgi:hypothetical protein
MDKPTLEARKVQLKQQFDAAVSNANALQGAMQQIEWTIAQIDAEQTAADKAKVDAAVAAVAPETPVSA